MYLFIYIYIYIERERERERIITITTVKCTKHTVGCHYLSGATCPMRPRQCTFSGKFQDFQNVKEISVGHEKAIYVNS